LTRPRPRISQTTVGAIAVAALSTGLAATAVPHHGAGAHRAEAVPFAVASVADTAGGGSMDAYARKGLGLSNATIKQLRAKLLVGAPRGR
jgi:hypothetical protein